MSSAPSFTDCLMLVGGVVLFLGFMISDVLEEQMLGRPRRERRKAAHARAQAAKRREVKRPKAAALPAARVHRGS